MATKAKTTRKPAAKVTAPAESTRKEGDPNKASEVCKLIARLDLLNAEQTYQSRIAATLEESNACFEMHRREISQIERRLAEIVPADFGDAMNLLRFAVRLEHDGTDDLALSILETAIEALPGLVAEKVEAAAIEAEAKAFAEYKWLTATTTEITEREIANKRRKAAA
jgi:hypothetical protein